MTHQTVSLDVREDLGAGSLPCARILEVAESLREGDTLRIIAPFEPAPLYELLSAKGFGHETKTLGDGDWEVRFRRGSNPGSGHR